MRLFRGPNINQIKIHIQANILNYTNTEMSKKTHIWF